MEVKEKKADTPQNKFLLNINELTDLNLKEKVKEISNSTFKKYDEFRITAMEEINKIK